MVSQQIIQIAQFIGWIALTLGSIIVTTVFIITRFRLGTDKAEKEKDGVIEKLKDGYKERSDMLQSRVEGLDSELKETNKVVNYLRGREELFKEVFTSALTSYFRTNPEEVNKLKDQVQAN